ncbi:immunoglobulin lambda-1 light chain-like [Clarias magur]|nr:immunoglobulin lambda-1 light chain-like [Clarias magur]
MVQSSCKGVLITQWPKYTSSFINSSVDLHCYQNDTDYQYTYWYRQMEGKEPLLIASYVARNPRYETGFEKSVKVWGSETKKWSLTVTVGEDSAALYLCAASFHNPSLSSEVIQTAGVIENPGGNVNLSCKHTYKDYFYLYWYQQTRQDTALKLTGHLYTTTFNKETDYEKRFRIHGDAKSEATLQISNLNADDSAVYFCAVRESTVARLSAAYFKNSLFHSYVLYYPIFTSPAVTVM